MTGWFRVWEDMADDPKWGAIGKAARVPPGLVLGLAIKLLTRASTNGERGSIAGYNAEALAYGIGCKAEKIEAMIAGMKTMGVIVDDRFVAWDKRQPKREDNSADRVRAHRERAKSAAAEAVTQCNAPEADADEDKKAAAAADTRTAKPNTDDRVGESVTAAAAASIDFSVKRDQGRRTAIVDQAVGLHRWICERLGAPGGYRGDLGVVIGWLEAGFVEGDIKGAVEDVLMRNGEQLFTSLRYFEGAIADRRRRRRPGGTTAKPRDSAVITAATATAEHWRQQLDLWARQCAKFGFDQKRWPDFARWSDRHPMGPPPDSDGCRAPPELVDAALSKHGLNWPGAENARVAVGQR
ncbi:hypothetical protein OSH11_13845 [Kaistia dalseonensis]|uniref:Replication protein n=1 Tax=Kaistia dalseonensis TaxID=410840 RepID=A0ABU0H7W4_9HYPH|nr:hypothetical protein [Kaistia dalseonensis]MCX5495792.1 hypothetical protein [Kaistia dalseonensis]MDQ0438393.1 hypothetical protein [Kaistia dalseonensis]